MCLVLIPSLRKIRPISYTRSNPPTTSLLRCSSVAMRSVRFMPSALWKVLNGLASAPPALDSSTGVSISINDLSSRNLRMPLTIPARVRNVSRTSGLAMRSTYRCRYRISTSVKPLNLSGSGRSDFVSISNESTATESSPFSVRFTVPRAPTMSPMSTRSTMRLNAPGSSASMRFLSQYSWMDPPSSSRDKNASFPNTRLALTLPHTASTVPSTSAPFSRSACIAWSSEAVWVRSNLYAKGSAPASLS